MIFSNLLTKRASLICTTLGSLLVGLPMISSVASAAPIAQLPSQQPATTNTIMIPSTGAMVQLSQIRVASIPPAPQNPCPSIYYENPHNQRVVVPQVCRPNLITQQLDELGMLEEVRTRGDANVTGTSGRMETPYTTPNTPY